MRRVQPNLLFKLSTRGSWKKHNHTQERIQRRTKVVTVTTERALDDHDDNSKVFPVDLLTCITIKHKHAHIKCLHGNGNALAFIWDFFSPLHEAYMNVQVNHSKQSLHVFEHVNITYSCSKPGDWNPSVRVLWLLWLQDKSRTLSLISFLLLQWKISMKIWKESTEWFSVTFLTPLMTS